MHEICGGRSVPINFVGDLYFVLFCIHLLYSPGTLHAFQPLLIFNMRNVDFFFKTQILQTSLANLQISPVQYKKGGSA